MVCIDTKMQILSSVIDVLYSVYHLDPSSSEPVGGVARFQTVCNHYRDDESYSEQPRLLTLFSGDAFNPSLESSVTKGKLS
jgi:5'-nucleotidase